jgi:hypothetical protein
MLLILKPQEAIEMIKYVAVALILLSEQAFAGEVDFIGFNMTDMEQSAIRKQMELAAPEASLQLRLLPVNQKYRGLTSVNYMVMQGTTPYSGAGAGLNQFDAAQAAVGRALDDITK